MKEAIVHYLWQFQLFDKAHLTTAEGQLLHIISPGQPNKDAGPDFHMAKIKVGEVEWIGDIEIHVNSKDWYHHHHDKDSAYDKVVLHVVWEKNATVYLHDGHELPTLALQQRALPDVVAKADGLIGNLNEVPCSNQLHLVSDIVKLSMIEKATYQRIEEKAGFINGLLVDNKGDWEETAYQALAYGFGLSVNRNSFLELARSLPFKILKKHSDDQEKVEALLFGQAGMLQASYDDEYFLRLKSEYHFLSQKYGLAPLDPSIWKFARLRPPAFPSLRIAQLAAFLCRYPHLFHKILDSVADEHIYQVLPSAYWKTHYRFGKASAAVDKPMGVSGSNLLIINVVVPLMFAYGQGLDNQGAIDRALDLLEKTPAEKNAIIDRWKGHGLTAKNAADTQGLIELYKNFCTTRKCLSCNIGHALLKR